MGDTYEGKPFLACSEGTICSGSQHKYTSNFLALRETHCRLTTNYLVSNDMLLEEHSLSAFNETEATQQIRLFLKVGHLHFRLTKN